MRVGLKKLVEANKDLIVGNHRMYFMEGNRNFVYYSTIICLVKDREKIFEVSCGSYPTVSTKQAISQYRSYFLSIGYKEVIR